MAKRVLVTGGSGKLGKSVLVNLLEHGYQVINADRQPAENVRTMEVDLCNIGNVYAAMSGVDAVVHLAAIPSPGRHPPDVVLHTNVMSTFNVLEVAAALGIKKVVLASSLSALGLAYKIRQVDLHYFPIDEAHPLLAQDCYGLSKIIGETLADGFVRRDPIISLTSLRFTYIMSPEEVVNVIPHLQKRDEVAASILWTYIDVRDAAECTRLALEDETPGHQAFYANAPQTFMNVPTLDLIQRFYPNVPVHNALLEGTAAPIDCSAAREQLGFEPIYLRQATL